MKDRHFKETNRPLTKNASMGMYNCNLLAKIHMLCSCVDSVSVLNRTLQTHKHRPWDKSNPRIQIWARWLGKQPPYQRDIPVLHVVFGDQKTKSAMSEPKVRNILYASIQTYSKHLYNTGHESFNTGSNKPQGGDTLTFRTSLMQLNRIYYYSGS